MSVRILVGDVREKLQELEPESIDCVVTSPPYWGLRSYLRDDHPDKAKEIGLEPTLGDHLNIMVEVFDLVRRAMKPEATLWLNYGDCYATKPNGRSAAATKATGKDDRTFRDKPFSTVGPIYAKEHERDRRGSHSTLSGAPPPDTPGRIMAGGTLKPKDLCMIPNRLAIALQDAGWWVRSEIVWGKPNPMPDSSGRYRPSTAHEKLFLLSKSARCFYDAAAVALPCSPNTHARLAQNVGDQIGSARANAGRKTNGTMKAVGNAQLAPKSQKPGIEVQALGEQPKSRYLRNYERDLSPIIPPEVWNIATAASSEAHFATFPPALVAPCIMAGCPKGGTVLDPFGGSGTTALVADRLQRNAVLIDLNDEYAEMMERRLRGDSSLFAEVAAA